MDFSKADASSRRKTGERWERDELDATAEVEGEGISSEIAVTKGEIHCWWWVSD